MKNFIIGLAAVVIFVMGIHAHTVSNERDFAVAQVNLDAAKDGLHTAFNSLAEKWGDCEDIDTLISNDVWSKIESNELSADEMVALAQTVETSYNAAELNEYADVIDDSEFRQAVKTYNECKDYVEETK